MFCKNCGSQLEDGSKFCGKCGSSVLPIEKKGDTPFVKTENSDANSNLSSEDYKAVLLLSEVKHLANKIILGGVGWIIAGIVITAITYSVADSGETYFVFWGLSVYGLFRVIKGIYYRISPAKLLNELLDAESGEPK